MGLWDALKKNLGLVDNQAVAAAKSAEKASELAAARTAQQAAKAAQQQQQQAAAQTQTQEGAQSQQATGKPSSATSAGSRVMAATTISTVDLPGEGARHKAIREARLKRQPGASQFRKPLKLEGHKEALLLSTETFRTKDRGLCTLKTDSRLLERHGLPVWNTQEELAASLGISLGELRHYGSHRLADKTEHYVTFAVPKRGGGQRLIMAPKRRLKAIQRQLLTLVVSKLAVDDKAHGFVVGRSVKTNAQQHTSAPVLLKMDLKEFFPSVHFGRVRGYLVWLGYGYIVATTLACLMTQSVRQRVETNGKVYYAQAGKRHCVQGAPTSPGLCNALVRRLDRRLTGVAKRMGCVYTRYADDLTFSGPADLKVVALRAMVGRVIRAEGFNVNRKKTRVARAGTRQDVTGVNVGGKTLGISRDRRRNIRAAIHGLKKLTPESEGYEKKRRQVLGRIAWVRMINPEQAESLMKQMKG